MASADRRGKLRLNETVNRPKGDTEKKPYIVASNLVRLNPSLSRPVFVSPFLLLVVPPRRRLSLSPSQSLIPFTGSPVLAAAP